MATAVQPEKLLKEIEHVWAELSHGGEDQAVLRACAMTLVVATTGDDDEQAVKATLSDLMRTHPGRMIILRIVESGTPVLEAGVTALCQLAFGRRQQICCEIIEIRTTRDRMASVYSASLGLTVADLPVILWLRDARLLDDPAFEPMLRVARTLILDAVPLGTAGLERLAARRRAGWRIKDLAWTRCTAWRETLAQAFENSCMKGRIADITRVEIVYAGGQGPMVSGVYLRAWLDARLPAAKIQCVSGEARRKGNLQGLRFFAGDVQLLELRAVDDAVVEIATPTLVTRVLAPARAEADLVAEELSILGDDPIYDATLAAAIHP